MNTPSVAETINAISTGLLSKSRLMNDTGLLDQSIVDCLRAAGIPIDRYVVGMPSLHPQVDSFSTQWEPATGVTFKQYTADSPERSSFNNSPFQIAYEEGGVQRFRLEGEIQKAESDLLEELRRSGFTDYVVLALPFSDGTNKAMSLATRQRGGFSKEQVLILEGLRFSLAATVEVRFLRHLAGLLMDTYVGRFAGRRVLQGAIKRGSGENVRAVICFCDLKGFTSLSETLPSDALIETLNEFFDAATSAIEAHGGEVLKYIGDAVLAIFPPSTSGDVFAAKAGLGAASALRENLAKANELQESAGRPAIGCGMALHVGDVVYGNVGGKARLDFTVIGPAVNLASRIEALTRKLDRPILVSEAFAELAAGQFECVGSYSFQGIDEHQKVLAPVG